MTVAGNFALLVDLARETSAEKRRELLLRITDSFLADLSSRSETEAILYDELVAAVTADMGTTVRAELAQRLAGEGEPLGRTALRLALDVIEVAYPVLEYSPALVEKDLLEVIEKKGDEYGVAITRRPDITERVSSALVAKGSDKVLVGLLTNPSALIDRATYERVAERAFGSTTLHAPFVRNKRVPPDLLQSIFLVVEDKLRREILGRFQHLDPRQVETALNDGRRRLSLAYGALPEDLDAARTAVDRLEAISRLRPAALVDLLRDDKRTAFMVACARLTGVDVSFVQFVVEKKDIDTLATLCRSAAFERAIFLSLAIQLGGPKASTSHAHHLAELYEKAPVETARRAVSFWKIRSKENKKPAAA